MLALKFNFKSILYLYPRPRILSQYVNDGPKKWRFWVHVILQYKKHLKFNFKKECQKTGDDFADVWRQNVRSKQYKNSKNLTNLLFKLKIKKIVAILL